MSEGKREPETGEWESLHSAVHSVQVYCFHSHAAASQASGQSPESNRATGGHKAGITEQCLYHC